MNETFNKNIKLFMHESGDKITIQPVEIGENRLRNWTYESVGKFHATADLRHPKQDQEPCKTRRFEDMKCSADF